MCNSTVSEMRMKTIEINIEFMRKRFMNPDYSNLTLIVEGQEFPVIRDFLAMHSTFFEVLFSGSFEDGKKNRLPLEDVKVRPFKILLSYIYNGDIDLKSADKQTLLEVAELAHFFGMPAALQRIENKMLNLPINADNAVEILNLSALYDLKKLVQTALKCIFSQQETFIQEELFVMFNEAALFILLDSDKWSLKESIIVQRLANWLNINPTSKRKELCQRLRINLLEPVELIRQIRPLKILTDDEIFDNLAKRDFMHTHCIRYIKKTGYYRLDSPDRLDRLDSSDDLW